MTPGDFSTHKWCHLTHSMQYSSLISLKTWKCFFPTPDVSFHMEGTHLCNQHSWPLSAPEEVEWLVWLVILGGINWVCSVQLSFFCKQVAASLQGLETYLGPPCLEPWVNLNLGVQLAGSLDFNTNVHPLASMLLVIKVIFWPLSATANVSNLSKFSGS